MAEGLDVLATWRATLPSQMSMRIWLGGDACRLASSPAVRGARNPGDAKAAVAAWMNQRNLVPPGWDVCLPQVPSDEGAWRIALVPSDLVKALSDALGHRLRSVRPWWSWAHQAMRASNATGARKHRVCGTYDGEALTLCSWTDGGQLITAETISGVPDIESVQRMLRRRGLVADDDVPVHLAFLNWRGHIGLVEDTPASGGSFNPKAMAEFSFSPWVRFADER